MKYAKFVDISKWVGKNGFLITNSRGFQMIFKLDSQTIILETFYCQHYIVKQSYSQITSDIGQSHKTK